MLSKEKLLSIITNKFIELIIFPTEQCNFRCVYCYEDFSFGKMKKNTVEAIKRLILHRVNELDGIKVTWFGGEPLAAKDIIFEICDFIKQLKVEHPHFQYVSDMTTNGYRLNIETLSKLVAHGVTRYQISLDGTEENHNKSRVRLDGAGTFAPIWDNLLSAKATDLNFSIILRLHITPENLEDMYRLIDLIKLNFGQDKRFTVFLKAIENLGGPNSGSFKTLRGQDKKDVVSNLYAYLGDEIKATKLNDNGPYVCYAAMTNSFVIRADGKICKCTVALSDERNILGELKDDGTIAISPDKLALWTRGIKSQSLSELSCPMYQMPKIETKLRSIPVVVSG
ncbi:MAG: radical SAM protein [Gammaproteobacteria bacterium]